MGFAEQPIGGRQGRGASIGSPDDVTMSLYDKTGSPDSRQIRMRIGHRVLARLKWKIGNYVHLREGVDGADLGFARLTESTDGRGHLLTKADAGGAANLNFGLKKLEHNTTDVAFAPHEMIGSDIWGSALTIKFPDWMKPIETAAKEGQLV